MALARLEVVNYPGGDLCSQPADAGTEAVRAGLVIGSGGTLPARAPRGQPVPQVPARFLEAVGRNEAHI